MKSTILTRAAVRVALALGALMLAGCSQGEDPKPALNVVAPTAAEVAGGSKDCPPVQDACFAMAAEVRRACPPDAQYDDEVEKAACYEVAVRQALAHYQSCFKDDEIQSLLGCVADAYENDGKGGIPENGQNDRRSRGERELHKN